MLDLHIHTNLSDGAHSVEEIIDMIVKKNIHYFSITDHDLILTRESYRKIYKKIKLLKRQGYELNFIDGIEVSSKLLYKGEKISVHLLGFGINKKRYLKKFLKKAQKIRRDRNILMAQKFKKFFKERGYDFNKVWKKDEIAGKLDISRLSRAHFAKFLEEINVVENSTLAFEMYLSTGKPLYVPKKNIFAQDVIKVLNTSCKASILAHPGITFKRFDKKDQINILSLLKEYGISGIEVFYSGHSENEEKFYYDYVKENGLIFTAGSDFHGRYIRDVEIGEISQLLDYKCINEIIKIFE
jgi:predicted metal-dependent phosphoesterase TrpH